MWYGWFGRWATVSGAEHVRGLDLSERMLDRARAMTDAPGIHFERDDLSTADLGDGEWDLVYSSLAFHHVEDLDDLLARTWTALRPGGTLVATTEHPIFSARSPGWTTTESGGRAWASGRTFRP